MAKRLGFNYEIVENKSVATKAQDHAKQIRKLLEQSGVAVISIGRLMAEVKEGMVPVVFNAWVEAEFGWVESVASNYMQAARVFGDLDCLKQFQASAICMLARKNVAESIVKDAIKRARAGELITYTLVNQLLKAAGHKPTNPSANKPRKPLLRPIQPEQATFTQVRASVESLATILAQIVMDPAERDALSTKFFELSMLLRQPSVPAAPAAAAEPATSPKATSTKSAAADKATSSKPTAAEKSTNPARPAAAKSAAPAKTADKPTPSKRTKKPAAATA